MTDSTKSADLLSAIAGEAKEKKSTGHWIGRFTPEEYTALCGYFGKSWIAPKDLKALLLALPAGKVALYDPNKYELIAK